MNASHLRKDRRCRFSSQLARIQRPLKNRRTCFEGPFEENWTKWNVRNAQQITHCGRGHWRLRLGFRKACRSRFRSYPLQSQPLPGNARTCFEGPFGEVIRATGPMAKANPFRFSTKYQDDETDLLYYGYRYYNASRWLSRDPVGERGGDNLYAFSGNDLLNFVDYLGLKPDCSDCTKPVNVLSASPDAPGVRGKDKIADDKEGNVARLLSHIVNQVQKGECLKRLTIVAHGNPDIIDIGGSPDSTPPGDLRGRVNRDVSIDERNARRVGERIKKLICFCKPCEVYILSCNVGLGKIAQQLANGTGCKVFAPNGYCYPNRKGPDDSKIVPKTRKHPAYPGGGDEFVPFAPQP